MFKKEYALPLQRVSCPLLTMLQYLSGRQVQSKVLSTTSHPLKSA
jgi:hypothetical protein